MGILSARIPFLGLPDIGSNAFSALPRKTVNIEASDKGGRTALHYAAASGSKVAVSCLLNGGADKRAVDEDSKTALHYAAASGSVDAVMYLLEHGADTGAVDKDGKTELHHVAASGSEGAILRLHGRIADINVMDKDGKTVLHYAAASGSSDAVRGLLKQGAEVKAADKDGKTALHYAAASGSSGAIRDLLDHGADVKAADKDGKTALHYAAASGSEGAVLCLLEGDADIKAVDKDHKTAMHYAAAPGLFHIFQILVSRGADVRTADITGQTPIQYLENIVHDSFWMQNKLAVATCLQESTLEWQSLFFLPVEDISAGSGAGLAPVARIVVNLGGAPGNEELWKEVEKNILRTIPGTFQPLIAIEKVKASPELYSFEDHRDVQYMKQCHQNDEYMSCSKNPPRIHSGDRTVFKGPGFRDRTGTLGGLLFSEANKGAMALTCGHVVNYRANGGRTILNAGDLSFGTIEMQHNISFQDGTVLDWAYWIIPEHPTCVLSNRCRDFKTLYDSLDTDRGIQHAILTEGKIKNLHGRKVAKCGAKTGIRTGTVCDGFLKGASISQMYRDYNLENIELSQPYPILSVIGQGFAGRGDSGAWIVDSAFDVVGVLFGGESHGGQEVTYFTPLSAILEDILRQDANEIRPEIFQDT